MPKIVIISVSVLSLLLILGLVVMSLTCRHTAPPSRLSPSPHQLRKAEELLQLQLPPPARPDLLYPHHHHSHHHRGQHHHQVITEPHNSQHVELEPVILVLSCVSNSRNSRSWSLSP